MKNALAVNRSKIRAASPEDRELALVEAFNRALVAASETQDVAVKAQIVQDARALSAMAAAYRVSEETQRKISEASIRLQRSFGASLMATYPNASGAEMQAKTGVPAVNCRRGIRLAKYNDASLATVFEQLRKERVEVGIERTLKGLLENDPAYRRDMARKVEMARKRQEEYEAQRMRDPDYDVLMQIWHKTGNHWTACQEVLRLSREVVRLKSELHRSIANKCA